jgi:hypothetical protein
MCRNSQSSSALADIQQRFSAAVLSADEPTGLVIADIRDGDLSASRRIEIYQHNVFTNLSNALADVYPVILNIVGEPFFRQAAREYCRANASQSGDLNDFGGHFADFLCGYAPAAELPYLPEVARLEWLWHRAFHSANAAEATEAAANSSDAEQTLIARLGTVAPDDVGGVLFELHPSAAVLSSLFPVFDIWRVNQPDYAGNWEIDWEGAGGSVLVYRDGFDVALRALTPGEASFLVALSRGEPLAVALELAFDQHTEFNLQGFLLECAQSNIIIDFQSPTCMPQ